MMASLLPTPRVSCLLRSTHTSSTSTPSHPSVSPSCAIRSDAHTTRRFVSCAASPRTTERQAEVDTDTKQRDPHSSRGQDQGMGLGDLLGPIGLTIGGGLKKPQEHREEAQSTSPGSSQASSLSVQEEATKASSIHSMSTEEWRALYERDGSVDLWMEEEFNAGSRLVGGRAVHKGGMAGILTGEGPSLSNATRHRVQIQNHYSNQLVDVEVPEDRYILWEAEDAGLELPYACRMGCCTACAVRIKEGEMYQPEALGISAELREQGYGLMCVGYPLTDLVLETVPEDEVYELQFGLVFASKALDANAEHIERDDFALGIANMDE